MTLAALVVVVLAVTAALVYNRLAWRPRQVSGRASHDGVPIAGIIGPLGTLSVLLLVFVLVQTYASWSAAGEAETAEATATLLLFREADLVKDARTRNRLRAAVVCYATSVIRQEWPAMQNKRVSNVPTYWGARIREDGVRLTRTTAEKNAGENLVARDGERAARARNASGRRARRCWGRCSSSWSSRSRSPSASSAWRPSRRWGAGCTRSSWSPPVSS